MLWQECEIYGWVGTGKVGQDRTDREGVPFHRPKEDVVGLATVLGQAGWEGCRGRDLRCEGSARVPASADESRDLGSGSRSEGATHISTTLGGGALHNITCG